jgi:4-hydroxybenzoate polyprenyltransferase/phosphoserine phosphatase
MLQEWRTVEIVDCNVSKADIQDTAILPGELLSHLPETMPLVVDLDGTLIRSDILVESTFAHLGQNPLRIGGVLSALARGKAALKARIAAGTEIDVAHLPYDEDILALIRQARASGRPTYLASGTNEKYVRAIAEHLGLFDGWFASDESENLSSTSKARRLVKAFNERGFDYVGNDSTDLAVWAVARHCIAVRVSRVARSKLISMDPGAVVLETTSGRAEGWVKLLRVHQWAKNALVFVPLLTAQRFDLLAFGQEIKAFFAFSIAASGVYILNDLVDLDSDRKHPSKRRRPLADATVSVSKAMIVAPSLVTVALAGSLLIAPWFAVVLLGYILFTTAYTFVLKRKMMVDVVALASLYTIRVIGGAAAISVPVSEWLLGFSMFIFTALALIKRYTELAGRLDAGLPDPSNRNYRKSDLDIVAALAAAAGFNAVTVFALYISSETVHNLYRHPKALWLICPILMYWLGRILMMAHRRLMDDDPIVFALKDRNSLLAFTLIGAILISAI